MNRYSTIRHVYIAFFFIILFACEEVISEILVTEIVVEGEYITDGGSTQMTAVISPTNASDKSIEWSVSNATVANIDQNGLLSALSNGTTRVFAKALDGSGAEGSKLMGVEGIIVPLESLLINGDDITDGNPEQYTVTAVPQEATNKEVTWSVSDPEIAVISADGILTPLDNGTVTIFATSVANNLIKAERSVTITGFAVVTETLAFPGAEGFGQNTTGGRGGSVIYVTNLNDSGSGSLRAAINTPGRRYILFRVSGTIALSSKLNISEGNVTIAGQTAPGDGITISNYPVTVDASNVIIRFLRFRLGDTKNQEADALGSRFNKDIIVDHCSLSWSVDECLSFYVNENTTVQWTLVAQSLNNSVHSKGAHGYGGIWGGKKASFHHNLLAHHNSRNPRLGEPAGDAYALTDLVDLRNNVIYNWGANSCYGAEAMNVNIVNCYYKPGPASSKRERIIAIDYFKTDPASPIFQTWGKFYIDGNYVTGSSRATDDNWTYGVYNQFHPSYGTVSADDKAAMQLNSAHDIGNNVTTHSADEAYLKVLDYVGAVLARDIVDAQIIEDVRNGTYTYSGSAGSTNGIIDSQNDVGGWPELNSTQAPEDSSLDGMPDTWKLANGLNPDLFEANGHDLHSGYENIEVYINSLVSTITNAQY